MEKIYRWLSFRPRSEKEIADYLKKRKTKAETAERIFKTLKRQNLIDDRAFASWWLEQRATFRPKGKIGLKAELKQKGVDNQTIEEALNHIDELELARKAISKKLKTYGKLPRLEFRQKITTFLSYRGFSWPTIKKILSTFKFLN